MIRLPADRELAKHFGNEHLVKEALSARQVAPAIAAVAQFAATSRAARTAEAHAEEARQMNLRFQMIEHERLRQAREAAQYSRPPVVIPAPVQGQYRWDGNSVPVGLDMGMVRLAAAQDVAELMAKEAVVAPLLSGLKRGLGSLKGMGTSAVQGLKSNIGKMPSIKPPTPPAPPATLGQSVSNLAGKAASTVQQGAETAKKIWNTSGVNTVAGAKSTALGLGALGAVGYGAVKGGKALGHVMSEEAPSSRFGGRGYGGSPMAYGINEYGQPDLRAPFM